MTTDSDPNRAFLGSGVTFPLQLVGGDLGMSSHDTQVRQSILLILGTSRGERPMRQDFGGGLETIPFEPLSAVTAALIRHRVSESLSRYEPRIELIDVEVTPDGRRDTPGAAEGVVFIEIHYRVALTDTVTNLVFPFYVERGVL